MQLFNKLFTAEDFPATLSTGLVHALHKGGDPLEFDNYRGITVGPAVGKLFAMVLEERLTRWAETQELRAIGQAGFRRGFRTTDQLFVLRTLVEQSKANLKPLHCCFVDFKKAFDTVPRARLWEVLKERGIGGNFLPCLQAMYAEDTVRVSHPTEGVFHAFRCYQGVKQGCPLSPLLFGLYLDGFESCEGREGFDSPSLCDFLIWLLLFADDLVLMSETVAGLQNQLDALEIFCRDRGLTVNVAKTKVLTFVPLGTTAGLLTYAGREIERVTSFKYLGVVVDASGNFSDAVELLVAAARRACFALRYRAHFRHKHVPHVV